MEIVYNIIESLDKAFVLGWVSNCYFIFGLHRLSQQKKIGFFFNAVANLLYAFQSIILNNSSLYWLSLLLITMNVIAIVKWSRKNNK